KDGKMLATGGYDGKIIFWDATGKRVGAAENTGVVVSLSWSPDASREAARQLASGATDGKVTIWDVPSGTKVRTFEDHLGPVYALAWCPTGKLLAAGGYDRPVKAWNLESGQAD